jgi:phosphoserine phosphatase
MTTKIILVRHGQTTWNVENRFRGSQDIPLDEAGIAQAHAVSKRLASQKITAVYSSQLQRALKTAEIIGAPHALSPISSDGLSNINYGELEGRLISEIAQEFPEFYRDLLETPHLVQFPGGNTLTELTARSTASLREMISQHPNETIVAVSHQVVTRVLICAILGMDNSHHWEISQDTCCINVFRYRKDRFIVDGLNDTCHLTCPSWSEP